LRGAGEAETGRWPRAGVAIGKDGFPLEEAFPEKKRQVAPLLYVSQVMSQREVICLQEDQTLRDALELFLEKRVSGAPVVNSEGGLVGVLSMTDIIWVESTDAMQSVEFPFYPSQSTDEIAMEGCCPDPRTEAMLNMRVSSRMSSNPITIEPQELLDRAAALMIDRNINRLPVIHPATRNSKNPHGNVIGIITRLDIMRCLAAVWL